MSTEARRQRELAADHDHRMYREWDTAEDAQRSRSHYELPPEFFFTMLGGEWNVYSCNLWDADVTTVHESQERHLDWWARRLGLKPGMRVLDVGCGWGGPLTYLCRKYGLHGVGLTVSPSQRAAAEARAARYGMEARFIESHWRDFQDEDGFDVIYSDEASVHFNDLVGFFRHCYTLLRDDGPGVLAYKELHFTHRAYCYTNRSEAYVNQIFGLTGNYRTLADELRMLDAAGFALTLHEQIPMHHYMKTLAGWIDGLRDNRAQLESLVGEETYKQYRTFLLLVRRMFTGPTMVLDAVVGKKLPPAVLAGPPPTLPPGVE